MPAKIIVQRELAPDGKEEYVTARLVWRDDYYGTTEYVIQRFRYTVGDISLQDASGKKPSECMPDYHHKLRTWLYQISKLAGTLNIPFEESRQVTVLRWQPSTK